MLPRYRVIREEKGDRGNDGRWIGEDIVGASEIGEDSEQCGSVCDPDGGGVGLRQRKKRALKLEVVRRMKEDAIFDAKAATVLTEVLWGSMPYKGTK